ncbi:GntP family permease [Streptococcus suis]|uniref:GntP family permease n=1 Tax=Streptococcus suis TaxID=1307 RepID=A0A9X4MJB4_STRSU|nr:GntP family permease [Streptococcus suis]
MFKILVLFFVMLILLVTVVKLKLNTFIAMVFISILTGILLGIPLDSIPSSIVEGIGNTMGELSIVLVFGTMIGRLITDAGGANKISQTLIKVFGEKWIQAAVIFASFIIGLSLFFEVGMVILVPIIITISAEVGVPILYLGIPMTMSLITAHALLPPHPAPVAISTIFGVSPGTVLIYGMIVAFPIIIVVPVFLFFAQKNVMKLAMVDRVIKKQSQDADTNTPSFKISIFTSLMPVFLMSASSICLIFTNSNKFFFEFVTNNEVFHFIEKIIIFVGHPIIAMTISLIFSIITMGWYRSKTFNEIALSAEEALKSISMLLFTIAGGAAFKQILIDGGVSELLNQIINSHQISPLLLGWSVAMVFKLLLGSATLASMTTASLISKISETGSEINTVLLVLAIGAGSMAVSHVNDAGFWIFKESFNLNIIQTFKTWSLLNTVISIIALGIIVLLSFYA